MFSTRIKRSYVGVLFFLLLSADFTIAAAQPENSFQPASSGTVRPIIEELRPLSFNFRLPITKSCPSKPKGILDIYHEAEANALLQDKNVSVLIGHGIAIIANKPGILLSVEYVPVFISAHREMNNLSSEQVSAILKGKITDWKDLGSKEGRINIYLHKGTLQKKSFEKFSELSLGIKPEELPYDYIIYGDDYKNLEEIAGQDNNAFVIGLQELNQKNLKSISIDGVSFSDDKYPLTLPVYLYKKDTPQANDLSTKFVESMSKEMLRNRIIEYPANIR